jgi:site-specific recombinase XerD
MASAKIILFTHKKLKDGTYPIVLQVIKDRTRKLISLGHSTTLDQWDMDDNLPNKKHPNYKSLKLLIQKKQIEADKVIIDLDETGEHYNVNEIISRLKPKSSNLTVFQYTEDLIKRLRKANKVGNANVYQTALSTLKTFRKEVDLTFPQFTYRVIKDFEESLLANHKRLNSISVYLRTLRAIYNHAIKDKVAQEKDYPFKDLKIRQESTVKRAISKEDIAKIRKLELIPGSELDKARDYFLFSFNMRGMSFVDIAFLCNCDIVNGRVLYTRKKTGQKFSIKLTEEAKAIIDKYHYTDEPEGFVFQIIDRKGSEYLDYRNALRLTNKKLKTIGEDAGCSIKISTYVSRHSWATIAKRSGIPTAVISEGMGHNSEKTTQIYLDSFENEVIDDANELITG